MREPFNTAIPIIEKIEAAGYEAYFVGGSIRDYLLQRTIEDVDIATSALPHEIKALFPKTVDIGIEHGTILVIHNGKGYEVTTFRTESFYKDHRRPEHVTFIRSLEEDLKRRDFTMNAIAMNKKEELIDPFNGQLAIKKKLIETVGDPEERFHEDALRMLRAVRFVSQLHFQLHEKTKEALTTSAPLLQHIAVERKTMEFTKLLKGKNKKAAFHILIDTGVYRYLPGLSEGKQVLQKSTSLQMDDLTENQMWLVILFYLQTNQVPEFLRKWKLPAKKINYLTNAFHYLKTRMEKAWTLYRLYEAKLETATDVETVYLTLKQLPVQPGIDHIQSQFYQMKITDRKELAVDGRDLMAWFQRPGGPWIKKVLEKVEVAILNKEIKNEKEPIREWLQSCNHQSEKNY